MVLIGRAQVRAFLLATTRPISVMIFTAPRRSRHVACADDYRLRGFRSAHPAYFPYYLLYYDYGGRGIEHVF
jgi:hypothetical protein